MAPFPSQPTDKQFTPPIAVLACLSYTTCSTALTLSNKHIFSSEQVNYPLMLLSTQNAIVVLLLSLYTLCTRHTPFNLTLLKQMLIPCILFTLYIFTNARALRHVSLPILSVLKSLAPMGIALSERAIFNDKISLATWLAMLLIVVGNTVTMFNDVEYSREGYFWALCNVVINIVHVLSLRLCLSNEFSPVEKTIHANLIAAVLMMPIAFYNRQAMPFVTGLLASSTSFKAVFLLSCVLCAGIGASIFWVVQTTSGSTLSFVGGCNKFAVVILGGVLFKANITPVGWVSVFIGVVAGVVFTMAKARAQDGKGGEVKEGATDVVVEIQKDGFREKEVASETDDELESDGQDVAVSLLDGERKGKAMNRSGRG